MQPLQFIKAVGVAGLVSGIETGMIGAEETLSAFSAVDEAIGNLDNYRAVSSAETLGDLHASIGRFAGLPIKRRIEPEVRGEVLSRLTAHREAVELAVRLPMIGAAKAISSEAPYDLGAELRWIPAGTSKMGSADDDPYADDDEKPLRQVMAGGFFMVDHPATNAEFAQFLKETGRRDERGMEGLDTIFSLPDHPAVMTIQEEASAFAAWYGKQVAARTGRAVIGRLPTEVEWEKAAKGPSGSEFVAPATREQAHFGAQATRAVNDPRAYANGYGLKDVIGNVWERTSSLYEAGQPYMVLRGGSWNDDGPAYLRAAFRRYDDPDYRCLNFGFRVVVVPQDSQK